ncbi:carbohydrate ABC transporter permease [Mediterraneibacter gnavus]|uniref:carbohydrate ABC transporter permease n=1 Tax=Mediterraneibacter gnavus TaxID=33038 RepID=UPI00156DE862|nr:carbohydrate ABC transporter permease [Mediterraneibacter gnavus]NSD46179.1 carbohydrate ABC transporter permease [Mediterraneibacter gnavus]NSI23904.1 carbohydrate ABC transporter permease [Mediterraneibacter gnavus]
MSIDNVISIIISILGSSVITLILSTFIFQPLQDKKKYVFKQNTHAFPVETIQAARVDGLGEYGIFFRIYMPMMKSTYAAAGIFAFMASWNNYMWPLIALQSNDKFTLPLAVSNLAAGFTPDYGMVMVGIIISTIPTILVFFLLQKAFVEGMVGSVK